MQSNRLWLQVAIGVLVGSLAFVVVMNIVRLLATLLIAGSVPPPEAL